MGLNFRQGGGSGMVVKALGSLLQLPRNSFQSVIGFKRVLLKGLHLWELSAGDGDSHRAF
jgi:hypothetical protein